MGPGSHFEEGSIRVVWEARICVLHATIRAGPPLSGASAQRLLHDIATWTSACSRFDIIIGVYGSPGEDADWNAQLTYWAATTSSNPRIAFYGPAVDQDRASSYALSSGLDIRFFEDEAAARRWLAPT